MADRLDWLSSFVATTLKWISRARSPQTKGVIKIKGLTSTVEILRDTWGVPHIYANTLEDLLFAQGFVHAQDRLFQMDTFRRMAQGRLSEIVGKSGVEYDRQMRTLMLGRIARQQFEALDPQSLAHLQNYASGINAFIERGPYPIEYSLLRCRPEFWQVFDTLSWTKLMAWELSINWTNEILRTRLFEKLGPELAQELWPEYPVDWTQIVPDDEISRSFHLTDDIHGTTKSKPKTDFHPPFTGIPSEGKGSNNWAITGSRTKSGKPILANDMHLSLMAPAIWYENHLIYPGANVTGITFPGIPGVIAGHNEYVAWGFTDAFIDEQDLYLEHVRQDEAGSYLVEYDGDWYQAQVLHEIIHVRNQKDEPLQVIVTRHGPIINDLLPRLSGDQPLAIRWTGRDLDSMFIGLFAMIQSRSCTEFHEALRYWSSPAQNVVYGDIHGNIAYSLAAKVPIRNRGDGLTPVQGWSSEYEWNGYLPFERLPYILNPSQGYLATANNRTIGDDYPFNLGFDTLFGDRVHRINQFLNTSTPIDISYMKKMQLDQVSSAAKEITQSIINTIGNHSQYSSLGKILAEWNGSLSAGSAAAAVYEVLIRRLLILLVSPHLVGHAVSNWDELIDKDNTQSSSSLDRFYRSHGPSLAWLKTLLLHPDSHWFDLGNGETLIDVIQKALQETEQFLKNKLGTDISQWSWSRLHHIIFNHPLGFIRLLQKLFNRGPFPAGGDGTTIWATQTRGFGLNHSEAVGPPYRMIVDLGDLRNSYSVLVPGQSGNPASPHYDDQIDDWFSGNYHPMAFYREDVLEHAVAKLLINPCS